jgi:hypothetical protein
MCQRSQSKRKLKKRLVVAFLSSSSSSSSVCRLPYSIPSFLSLSLPLSNLLSQRRRLVGEGTPVTLERFLKWKADKRVRLDKERAERDKDQPKEKMNRSMMSGREMFVFNPDLFVDDDEAFDAKEYEHEEEQYDSSVPHNIITATATSITRTAVNVNATKEGEEEGEENAEGGDGAVDESLFADAGDIPDVDD